MRIKKEAIRTLQKYGEYHFEGLDRQESRKAAERLSRAAMKDDRERHRKQIRNSKGCFWLLSFSAD